MTTAPDTITDLSALLLRWYQTNHEGFADRFNAAIAGVQPPPPNPGNFVDWHGKTIHDLVGFFHEWYAFLPDVESGLDFIQKFSWLYYKNDAGLRFVTTGPGLDMTKYFVALRGAYMDSGNPPTLALIEKWMRELGAEMNQFVIPPGGYRTFNQFFARELKPGMRPIADPDDDSVVVAPADCVINMIVDDLTVDTAIPVKGRVCLNVRELLNGSRYAANFVGGTAVSCILMPNTYHHYHAPVSGTVVESNEDVAGEYFGMKDFPAMLNKGDVGYGYDYSVFEHFRRGYLVIRTAQYGHVAVVPVGLNTIASVVFDQQLKRVQSPAEVRVAKGDHIGYFQYGGSLNILLFEPGRFPSLRLLQGQRIGTFSGS